jgi:hypothetical protein
MGIDNINLTSVRERRPDDRRYDLWSEFLRLSPSYNLANRVVLGLATKAEFFDQVADAEVVWETRRNFGDVWSQSPAAWREKNTMRLFGQSLSDLKLKVLHVMQSGEDAHKQDMIHALDTYFSRTRPEMGNPLSVVISIPLDADRAVLLQTFSEMITYYKTRREDSNEAPAEEPLYALSGVKARYAVMEQALKVAKARAYAPKVPLWEIGMNANVNETYASEMRTKTYKKKEAVIPKNVLAATTGRFLRQAVCLAENAARGKFPCYDQNSMYPKSLDYRQLKELFEKHGNSQEFSGEEDQRLPFDINVV